MRRGLRAIVALTLVALPVGCGGGSDDDQDPPRAGTATTPTPATTSPRAQAAPQTARERITDCLEQEGYRLQGGAPQAADSEAPEYQIILSGPRGGGYIGFYKNASRATRVATQLRRNAQRTSGAAVERHGAINIVWVDLPDPAARAGVRGCLVT